ncbi:luciferin sulfotransferase-like [Homalodisca vitripennis]|uniref:Sulfotransferase domain-containing protein n=1 Tax=Homalodisca liturata TaxID=320908 RepID=A0A1B6IRV2_9HEMI|nr:luciferin sulfotransferase-like [Homalodisca vitripennis]
MPSALEYTPVGGDCQDLLERHFITAFRHGYVRCQGTVLPVYYKQFAEDILNLQIRDDDIWVCSFPKAGTTWTQEMVWCIANDLDFEGAKVKLPERFPFLEHTMLFNYEKVLPMLPDFSKEIPRFVKDAVGYINDLPSPRFIKSHLPFHLLPLQLQRGLTGAKVVYIARGVKDTCLSYFHHCQLLEGFKGSFHEFATLFINDSLCFAPFWDHVLGYWKRRDDPNMLFLKFEELKKDLPSVIKRTAEFLGKEMSTKEINILCDHLSFEKMKTNRAVNYEEVIEINKKYKFVEAEGSFMRSGQVGEAGKKFSPDWVQRFDQWTEDKLKDTGLNF